MNREIYDIKLATIWKPRRRRNDILGIVHLTEDVVVVDAVLDGLHVGTRACGTSLNVDQSFGFLSSGNIND